MFNSAFRLRRSALVMTLTEKAPWRRAAIIRRQQDAEGRVEYAGGHLHAEAVADEGEEEVLADVATWSPG